MISYKRAATTVWTGCLLLAIGLGGCGSVALQPTGSGGNDGGAAGAAGGSMAGSGDAGSGPAGHGGSGVAGSGPAGHGGSGGAGGSDAGRSPGTVTLRLNLPSSTSFCDMLCSGGGQRHITIYSLDKMVVPVDPPACLVMCSDNCQPFACPVGGACALLGVAVTGAELKWDGSSYPTSTCGGGAACYKPTFVPAGTYIAHMCATPGTLTHPTVDQSICTSGAVSCTDVTFSLPGKLVVEGTLGGVAQTCGAIRASDYDQTCKVDSDCVPVAQPSSCAPGSCMNCPTAAITARAEMQYLSDVASKFPTQTTCACPFVPLPVCKQGTCVL